MTEHNIVPFESMPSNIEELLTKEDYKYAIFHPNGMIRGIYEVIHLNELYPQWHNLIIFRDGEEDARVYTINGWKKANFERDIWDQYYLEYKKCVLFASTNKDKMFPRPPGVSPNIKWEIVEVSENDN